ncbi:MAG: hypothetical protein JW951_01835, partial [Lentisphaerae bacterium]|nr:hypothetical protein [Lentisphaerota bacterium]
MTAYLRRWVLFGVGTAVASSAAAGPDGWTFWRAERREFKTADYTELRLVAHPDRAQGWQSVPGEIPRLEAVGDGDEMEISAMPEADGAAAAGQGDLLAGWRCPTGGSYAVLADLRNVGRDVRGGDGGYLMLTVLSPGATWDSRTLKRDIRIPSSWHSDETVRVEQTVALAGDDVLLFRFRAARDGYGDRFRARIRIAPADRPGEVVPDRGPEGFLARLPTERLPPGPRMRPGLFWFSNNGYWACSEHAREAIALVRRFVPDLAVILHSAFPEALDLPDFYWEDG